MSGSRPPHPLRRLGRLALLVVVASLGLGAAPATAASDPRFGVVQAYESWENARNLGIAWQRMHFWWREAQPSGPDEWLGFSTTHDADIAASVAQGITVVGVIGNPPAWAVNRSGSVPVNIEDPGHPQNYWAQFVGRLASAYRGRIDHWVIWNEPDIEPGQPGSTWGGLDIDYFYLLRSAWHAIKRVNANARVGFAGTTIWADYGKDGPTFFERTLRFARDHDPAAPANGYYFDFVPVHVYTNVYNMHDYPQTIRNTLTRYGLSREIWLNEANVVPYDDPGHQLPRNPYRATQQEQANFILQGTALALAAGVSRIAPYKMQDSVDGNLGEPYGLVRHDHSPRPAYAAYRTAIQYLQHMGSGRWTRKAHHHEVAFRTGKRQVTVFWNPNGADTSIAVRMVGTRAMVVDKAGNVVARHAPTEPGASVILSLPRATASDGGPIHSIGGDPFLLVEDGVGDPVPLGETRLYYPITGYVIGGAFLEFFRRHGGVEVFGYPRSSEVPEDGVTVQYFQRARMEWRQDRGVELTPVNGILNGGRDFPDAGETANRNGLRYFPETRQSVQGQFLSFFNSRGGVPIFGFPISQEIRQADGKIVQHFQRMRLELAPGARDPQLALVGDEWMMARGMLRG